MKTYNVDPDDMLKMFNEYLFLFNNSFYYRYYFNFYYPSIKINNNDNDNIVIRMSINSYDFTHMRIGDLSSNEITLLHKILPIYYDTYDLDCSIVDIYKDKLIKMMKNKIRIEKLNNICSK